MKASRIAARMYLEAKYRNAARRLYHDEGHIEVDEEAEVSISDDEDDSEDEGNEYHKFGQTPQNKRSRRRSNLVKQACGALVWMSKSHLAVSQWWPTQAVSDAVQAIIAHVLLPCSLSDAQNPAEPVTSPDATIRPPNKRGAHFGRGLDQSTGNSFSQRRHKCTRRRARATVPYGCQQELCGSCSPTTTARAACRVSAFTPLHQVLSQLKGHGHVYHRVKTQMRQLPILLELILKTQWGESVRWRNSVI